MDDSKYILDSFSIENYRSFFKKQTINFDSTIKAFYGSNASGKTNLYNAMLVLRQFIEHSADPNSHGTPYESFLLSSTAGQKPSIFAITFHSGINSGEKYEYSVSVFQDHIVEEEMFDKTSSRPRLIFRRSAGYTETTAKNGFGKKMFEGYTAVRNDSLIITLARSTRNRYANAVYKAVSGIDYINLTSISAMKNAAVEVLQKKPALYDKLINLLKEADFSINSLSFHASKIAPEMLAGAPFTEEVKRQLLTTGQSVMINTIHSVRDENGDKVGTTIFDMESQESLGTNNFFILAVAILDAIDEGKTLFVDEFGASTHTKLCDFIIRTFKKNKTGARLIVNTHDTGLIRNGSLGILEKDEISIVEKDRLDETIITPLREKIQRADENIGKKYILGLYGGIPILSEVEDGV